MLYPPTDFLLSSCLTALYMASGIPQTTGFCVVGVLPPALIYDIQARQVIPPVVRGSRAEEAIHKMRCGRMLRVFLGSRIALSKHKIDHMIYQGLESGWTDNIMSVYVFGLGHVGLPMAYFAAMAGEKVNRIDTNPVLIEQIRNGTVNIFEYSAWNLIYLK